MGARAYKTALRGLYACPSNARGPLKEAQVSLLEGDQWPVEDAKQDVSVAEKDTHLPPRTWAPWGQSGSLLLRFCVHLLHRERMIRIYHT